MKTSDIKYGADNRENLWKGDLWPNAGCVRPKRGKDIVPHDDIFQEPAVAFIAFEVESMVRDVYVRGNIRITDRLVYEAYKNVYAIHFQENHIEESRLDEITRDLLEQHETNSSAWKANMAEEMIGKVYLRLMISVKKMTGGTWGDYGYLNYLKNNLGQSLSDKEFIVEDRFGNRTRRKINQ